MIEAQTPVLHLPSSTDNLSKVESLIDDVCSECRIAEDHYGNILVAVTEAVTNAIQHGNKYDPAKFIDVSYHTENARLCFTVKDEGQGFDFEKLPDPTSPENIEKTNGRGVFLMRNLADSIEFADNGKVVKLFFNLSAN
jgi:serine/threonine-protein kinase RsbW